MRKPFVWVIIFVLLGAVFLFKDQIKEINIGGLGTKPIEQIVNFSVIRFDGKAISVRLVVDANGKLESPHLISKDDVGIAFFEKKRMIEKIESYTSYRYINVSSGFSHELVTKKFKIR